MIKNKKHVRSMVTTECGISLSDYPEIAKKWSEVDCKKCMHSKMYKGYLEGKYRDHPKRGRKRFNLYGYWQFSDHLGLGCGIEKFDLIYAFKVKDSMVYAINEKGKIINFHYTNITKDYFLRPSYEYHKICELGKRSAAWHKTLVKSERHKNDCHKCQMYKFKQTVKRFKLRNKNG